MSRKAYYFWCFVGGLSSGVCFIGAVVCILKDYPAPLIVFLAAYVACFSAQQAYRYKVPMIDAPGPYNFLDGESRVWQMIIEGLPVHDAHVAVYRRQMAANGWPEGLGRGAIIALIGIDPDMALAAMSNAQIFAASRVAQIEHLRREARYADWPGSDYPSCP